MRRTRKVTTSTTATDPDMAADTTANMTTGMITVVSVTAKPAAVITGQSAAISGMRLASLPKRFAKPKKARLSAPAGT